MQPQDWDPLYEQKQKHIDDESQPLTPSGDLLDQELGLQREALTKKSSRRFKITGIIVPLLLITLIVLIACLVFKKDSDVPDPPYNLLRDNAATDQTHVSFTWDAPANDGGKTVLDYTVQLALEGDGFKDQQSGLTQTNYTLATDINAGEKYSFRVKARNSIGFSVFSPVIEIIAASKI